jgi:predicted nucleic acid-binding protein
LVVASDLTMVECDRILIRTHAAQLLSDTRFADLKALLDEAAAGWHLLRLDADTIARARRPFPREPIRTLDALHLASALSARTGVGGLALLTLDRRLREAGRDLGLDVLPSGGA